MSLIGKDYRNDEQILKLIEEARETRISPGKAEKQISQRLDEYFPPNSLAKTSVLEELTEGFFSSGGGMLTPLNERYALAKNLSGRITPETVLCPLENISYGSAIKGLEENEPP